MNKEKIMSFLNFDTKTTADKFAMKLFTGFNVGFSSFVVIACLLFGNQMSYDLSFTNVLFVIFSIVSNVYFFYNISKAKTVIHEWRQHFIVLICSILTLLYGWLKLSKSEYYYDGKPVFSWMHVVVFLASLILSGYMICKFIQAWKILEGNTLENAKIAIAIANLPKYVPIAIAGSPMILVRLLRGPFESMGLGLGFGLWALMCIWLFMLSIVSFKIYIILKYKVYRWIDEV